MADKIYELTFKLSDGTEQKARFAVPQGEGGKTAYEYAKDGGYTGTEEEFAAMLATEKQDKMVGTQYAAHLLYIASDGKITPLQLGAGLEIVDGVLNVVGGGSVTTIEVDASGNATISGAAFTVDENGNATIASSAFTVDAEGNATI